MGLIVVDDATDEHDFFIKESLYRNYVTEYL